jgi:hypothetical protein
MNQRNETLYVVTVIFNPHNFKSRYHLYKQFAPYVEFCGAKLFTVEIAYKDRPFEVTEANNPWNLQLRTDCVLWHKERGINIGIQRLLHLVPDAKYIAWIDADVSFTNPDWVHDTVHALHHYAIIQPFSQAMNLNPKYERMWDCPSAMSHFRKKLGYHQHPPVKTKYLCGGHPGLAWAARTEVLENLNGLMDFCIAGSGDTHMFNALIGDVTLFYRPGMTKQFQTALQRWAKKCDQYVNKNIGFINGICYHYWHGKSEQRGYEKRWDIINFHQFDPHEDIAISLNGLYKFRGNKPELEHDIFLSTQSRNEDSIDE